jgi:hypothetical protein
MTTIGRRKTTWAHVEQTSTRPHGSDSQALLLRRLFRKLGGPTAIARILGTSRNVIGNWSYRGHVPLVRVLEVSRALSVNPWGLNYLSLSLVLPRQPLWRDVIRRYGFTKEFIKVLEEAGEPWEK